MNLDQLLREAADVTPHPDPVGVVTRRGRRRRRQRRGIGVGAALVVPAAVGAVWAFSGSASPQPAISPALPTCGPAPRSTGPHARAVKLVVDVPSAIREGGTLAVTTSLSVASGTHSIPFGTGAPAWVTILRGDAVVARTTGVFGVGKSYLLAPGVQTLGPSAMLPLVQCHAAQVPDEGVAALPPGNYLAVAHIEDVGRGAHGILVSEPVPFKITRGSSPYAVGVQTAQERYTSPNILLAPPNRTPKLTAADAWARYRARGTGYTSESGQTMLKLVAYTNYGQGKERPDGSVAPDIVNRLAWVIEVPAVHRRVRNADLLSPVFVFVDANDGSLIGAAQSSQFTM
jgi:hypothetical protein